MENYVKEILGWMINGRTYTITLPEDRLHKIILQINKAKRKKKVPLNEMQKLAGKLQHASYAMPGGWGLFSPVQRALQNDPKMIPMDKEMVHCLEDWITILKHLAKHPTHVLQLVGYNMLLMPCLAAGAYSHQCKEH